MPGERFEILPLPRADWQTRHIHHHPWLFTLGAAPPKIHPPLPPAATGKLYQHRVPHQEISRVPRAGGGEFALFPDALGNFHGPAARFARKQHKATLGRPDFGPPLIGQSLMITVYGVYRSRALRPLWLLQEAGIEFTHQPVVQAYRGVAVPGQPTTASPEFLAVNPLGQIPVLDDDGLILTESLAITLYLARRHGGQLGPQSDAESALCEQWSLFAATGIEPAAAEIMFIYRNGGETSPEGQAALQVNAERLRRPLQRLEARLGQHDWLVADRFTAADINTAECLRYAQVHLPLLSGFPAVKAWLERCQARPAFKAIWERRAAEPE